MTPRPRKRPGLPGPEGPARCRRSCSSGRRRPLGRRRWSAGRSSVRERLLEVGPELIDVLEPDAQAEQVLRYAVTFPAAAALQHRVDTAEAGRIRDRLQGPFDARRISPDVEREHPAEAGITHPFD